MSNAADSGRCFACWQAADQIGTTASKPVAARMPLLGLKDRTPAVDSVQSGSGTEPCDGRGSTFCSLADIADQTGATVFETAAATLTLGVDVELGLLNVRCCCEPRAFAPGSGDQCCVPHGSFIGGHSRQSVRAEAFSLLAGAHHSLQTVEWSDPDPENVMVGAMMPPGAVRVLLLACLSEGLARDHWIVLVSRARSAHIVAASAAIDLASFDSTCAISERS